ncbi:GNAT family N-acetyltransferase [Agromyces intestinalis]|uniref:GNAT family N-acetyltransferase n=2 Tax=Agromyces intestinalis TaxID=2592652 RepID=A0A5C1YLC6_9MICO|nr:GNAT family N-acetyltransferase [Agromyces intestinalis]
MAAVIVQSWRETYRGLMRDEVLDAPDLLERRERFWAAALTDPRYSDNRALVAVRDGEIIGVAMSGPPLEPESPWSRQLFLIYMLAAHHGSGAGPALLDSVIDPDDVVGLWVAEANPRAQAFYRRHGFRRTGDPKVDDGVRVICMTRDPRLTIGA